MSDDDVGTLEEELRKLGIALGQWAQQPHDHDETAGHPTSEPGAPADPDRLPVACQSCPLCQLIALAQGHRTEGVDGLLAAVTDLVRSLSTYLERPSGASPAGSDDDEGVVPSRVERIDLS